MTTEQITERLTSLLKEGKFEDIYDTLFDQENVKHIEPQSPYFPDITGVKAIKEKDSVMAGNISEVHTMEIGKAITSKDFIALPYRMSFTMKDRKKAELDELIVYQVKNGKIILEQFFY
ncbi:SnoaL-like domain-containing protein [Polaribacter sp. MED152]|uniref:SnoaL-like domain-containing protein n=1 Tax=Polaribacter sp. MED152 TaxID=313598 RepID=UPI000068CC33|nr:SnoaL-like domain-containing protein [Polaribacter sp. MED152]EAQ42432.1 hypothetical protein MED152_06920 [Polaribacter sp. MED152]